ncbi:MAG: Gfo/Idh/MocA family oxidoreductase [Segetibacter sp.]|nr:Gfo/Idh/MocA family oxidoreductase [Segetibacter sp.]
MKKITWGIIGCGDVTEVKSGPAFNKVPNSSLAAVMRRDAAKAKDYAERHGVAKWYSNANDLINDPSVNAIYVATPPSSHEEYTIAALKAGKDVYVEKPMSLNAESAKRMADAADQFKRKLSVAHYRREQPIFKKIKQLLAENAIGDIRCADLRFFQAPLTPTEMEVPKTSWRIDPNIAGGGLFHDLAPHQIDLALYFFGDVSTANGLSANQQKLYPADDIVAGNILFKSGVIFNGVWCFNCAKEEAKDNCEIIGSHGKISFEVFGEPVIHLTKNGQLERIAFDKLQHVQQPMIEKVAQYFLGEAPNPCTAEEGVEVMKVMDSFAGVKE